MIFGLALITAGCLILWWRSRSLSYPTLLRPTIFQIPLSATVVMLLGLAFLGFGLRSIFKINLILAVGIASTLLLYIAVRLARNSIKARIDRVFKCHNEMRLINVVRQNRHQPLFEGIDLLREVAVLYARKQGWPRLKIESFRLSFIDTDNLARVADLKELTYALVLFDGREERSEDFGLSGRHSKYLDERYERANLAV
jgi:hypothetical protein